LNISNTMLLLVLNVLFVLVAIAMIALILMQRGTGASAGTGFGGGASATVFGARGSANFLSKATKWLTVAFFGITLFMAWYAGHRALPAQQGLDLGVMGQVPAAPVAVPVAPAATVPEVPITPESSIDGVPATPTIQDPAQSDQ